MVAHGSKRHSAQLMAARQLGVASTEGMVERRAGTIGSKGDRSSGGYERRCVVSTHQVGREVCART